MVDYLDFTLSQQRFDSVIGALEKLCELSKGYEEIEEYIFLIQILQDQKNEHYKKCAKELKEGI